MNTTKGTPDKITNSNMPHRNMGHKECFSKLKRIDKIMWKIFLTFLVFAFCSCATKTKVEYRDRIIDNYNTIIHHDTFA